MLARRSLGWHRLCSRLYMSSSNAVVKDLPSLQHRRTLRPPALPQICTSLSRCTYVDFEAGDADAQVLEEMLETDELISDLKLSLLAKPPNPSDIPSLVKSSLSSLGIHEVDTVFVSLDDSSIDEIKSRLEEVTTLLKEGTISNFGLQHTKGFGFGDTAALCIREILSLIESIGIRPQLRGIRAPFNLFESGMVMNKCLETGLSVIEFCKDEGLMVYGERVLEAHVSPERGPVSLLSGLEPDKTADMVKSLKYAFDTVIYLEKQYASLVDSQGRLPSIDSLRWGHIIVSNQDQLMNRRVWYRTYKNRIVPSIHETVSCIARVPEHQHWASRYHDATQILFERFKKAVEMAAYHESVEVSKVLNQAYNMFADESLGHRSICVAVSAGADVLFTPEQHITMVDESIKPTEVEKIFASIGSHPFYFLPSTKQLSP